MSRTTRTYAASPELVFSLLTNPRSYAYAVPGARRIRRFDPRWPDAGTHLEHSAGLGPLSVRDTTVVRAVDPPHLLALEARLRPLGIVHVTFSLDRDPAGCVLAIDEHPVSGLLAAPALDRLVSAAFSLRNAELARRLRRLIAAKRRRSARVAVGA